MSHDAPGDDTPRNDARRDDAPHDDAASDAPPRVVTVGERFSTTLALPPDSIKAFATLVNDLNPLHHDAAYAARSRFGGLIASGTQPTAHWMALVATHFSQYAQPLGLEFDMKLKKAVRSGDTLTLAWQVTRARWKASLGGDLVWLDGEARNQRDEVVLLGKATVLVMPPEPRSASAEAAT
jgi:acyl dehydratase